MSVHTYRHIYTGGALPDEGLDWSSGLAPSSVTENFPIASRNATYIHNFLCIVLLQIMVGLLCPSLPPPWGAHY